MSILNRYSFQFNSKQSSIVFNNGSCIFQLSQPLTLTTDSSMFEIVVNRLSIPYCWYEYNATQGTSLFQYTVVSGPTSTNYAFSIPDGNYTVNQIMRTICQLGTAQMVSNSYISLSSPWRYTYDEISNKVSISLTPPTSTLLQVIILPTFLSNSIGFTTSTSFLGAPSYSSAVSQINVNVNPSMFVFITSPTLNQQTNFQALRGNMEPANIICAIDVDVAPRCYIHKDFSVPSVTKFTNTTLSTIQFDLINSRGTELIGFNLPWCMQFDIYEKILDRTIAEQTMDNYLQQPQNAIIASDLINYAIQSGIDTSDFMDMESEKEKQLRELNTIKEKIMKERKQI